MAATTSSIRTPCGACKFLRRKCASDCVFAPYFCSEQGSVRFAAIHKVFGASNVSKLLMRVPVSDRLETVVTISYEAQARLRDPVYGCVAHIFALQHQVRYLEAELNRLKAHLAPRAIGNHDQFQVLDDIDHRMGAGIQSLPSNYNCSSSSYPVINNLSSSSHSHSLTVTDDSFESVDHQSCCRSDGTHDHDFDHLGELQAIALSMMRT